MAQQPNALTNLYTDLNRHAQNNEYDRALKVCNKIIHESGGTEEEAFQCKIVCLLQLGRFEEALTAIQKNTKFAGNLSFEKAYSEYRLNRTNEALKTLRAVENPDNRTKELLGQVLYRLEDYSDCLSVYKDLFKNTQDDYEEERETNLSAVIAALQNSDISGDVEDLHLSEETYELQYNKVCYLVGRGQYQEALDKLLQAEKKCRESFEDDQEVTEEEIDAELGVIRVQRGYVLQKMGRPEEAMKLYNQVLKQRPSDIGLAAVASNNIVTLNKEANVFDSKKKMKVATADGLQQKLTTKQREQISMNQCLLFMYTNQGEQCKSTAKDLQKKFSENDMPTLIEAAQHVKDKQANAAIETLQKQIENCSGQSVTLKLTLAQLYLCQGHVYQACQVLRDLGDLSYKPGVVSSLVTLYMNQEDRAAASDVLNEAVNWYKANNPSSEDLVSLIRANANFQLVQGDPKVAATMLEELRKHSPQDMKTLAQLISAYSKFDPEKAQIVSRDLPSPEEVAQDVDVDNLESTACTFAPRYIKKATKTEASPKPQSPKSPSGNPELMKAKKTRKKKGKLPKNYDPEVPLDPERWLPRRERSYFKGKRRDKRKEISKGPQGAVSGGADLDASKQEVKSTSQSPPVSATSSEVGSPRPAAPSASNTSTASNSSTTPNPGSAKAGPRSKGPAGAKGGNKKKRKGGKGGW